MSPEAEKIGAEEFAMRWQGSVIAEDSGDYEFCLKSENGVRLWVNSADKPLIDAWVSSGAEATEHRETVRLLGGRIYPIKVDFFKFKDKSASVSLRGNRPTKVGRSSPAETCARPCAQVLVVIRTISARRQQRRLSARHGCFESLG